MSPIAMARLILVEAKKQSSPTANVGKKVGGAIYVHREAITFLGPNELERLARAQAAAGESIPWNVVRIGRSDVSFLEYEDFEQTAFPLLLTAVNVKLPSGETKTTSYKDRASKPVLHRKELLLTPDDPRTPQFAALTRFAEQKGLFKNTNAIGASGPWARLLEAANLEIRGSELVEKGSPHVSVARHRTALVRRQLSQPMALALKLGMIGTEVSVFDYGCGQGDDVAILQANGFEAFGWDPHFNVQGERRPADIVNLGFVLNVIESPQERVETLRAAWNFAKRALLVSVMNSANFSSAQGWQSYRDGVVTSRGTFQRYFSQDELRALVEMTLNVRPITLAPGIVAVFRDRDLEQEVTFRKRSAAFQFYEHARLDVPDRPLRERVSERAELEQRIAGQVEDIWRTALQLGRLPAATELNAELLVALKSHAVSPARAIAIAIKRLGESGSELGQIAAARREDLLVHFALTLFPGAPKYASLPRTIQLDVRAFFSSHTALLAEARALLFALGKGEIVREAVANAVAAGLAAQRGDKVRFASATLPRMPAAIRLLIGCGEVLEPELSTADFLDIYTSADRVRGLWCEDAAARAPLMRELADVRLSKLKVRRRDRSGEVLYGRGALLPPDHPDKAEQSAFDEVLSARGIVDYRWHGPNAASFAKLGLA